MTRARAAVLVLAAAGGIATGAAVAFDGPVPPAPPVTTAPVAVPATAEEPAVLLVWTAGGLPAGFAAEVAALDGVERSTLVRGDETAMLSSHDGAGAVVDAVEPGWHLPLDTLAVDPATFAPFLPADAAAAVRSLEPGEALLTATSAALRRLDVGSTIELAGGAVVVAGVIDDEAGAGAELLVAAADVDRLGVTTERYVLLGHTGARDALQQAVAARLGGRAVRFRSPAETRWLRHGDAVEPAAVLKAAFGEFSIRDGDGRDLDIDPDWLARSIVTEDVPILGAVTCHRAVLVPLRAALAELEAAGLAHLVDPDAFAGCFAARRTGPEPGAAVSHHAWGAALDLNVDGNPRGSFSTQDPRLVELMARHGFTWGGTWLVPDPAHYEAPAT